MLPAWGKRVDMSFYQKSIISVDQFSAGDVALIFKHAVDYQKRIHAGDVINELQGKILCALFYEPSSRTFSSFITAMQRLGGGFIPIQGVQFSSVVKGETLEDTIRVFSNYADVIALRHSEEGAAKRAADVAFVPVINAGDGVGEHPTQALLDLFTIHQKFGKTTGLKIAMVGDLKYGRTVHSLSKLLSLYPKNTIYFVEPEESKMPDDIVNVLKKRGVNTTHVERIEDVADTVDVLYMTRVQKERMAPEIYEKIKGRFVLTTKLANALKKEAIIMHPLPRIDEIVRDVDKNPRSVYFTDEVRNGMFVRMALLRLVLVK